MRRRTDNRSFLAEAAFGLAASVVGAALTASLAWVVDAQTALRIVIALLGGAHVLRGVCGSGRRLGHVVAGCGWLIAAGGLWLAPIELPLYAACHAVLAWLVRAALVHARPLPALLDLGITAIATVVAAWTASRTGSPLLAFWCFFLVQAMRADHRETWTGPVGLRPAAPETDRFETAYRAARAAIGALAARQ